MKSGLKVCFCLRIICNFRRLNLYRDEKRTERQLIATRPGRGVYSLNLYRDESGLKVRTTVSNLNWIDVSTYTAMKSGLKVDAITVVPIFDNVSTYTAMKSGLKEHIFAGTRH